MLLNAVILNTSLECLHLNNIVFIIIFSLVNHFMWKRVSMYATGDTAAPAQIMVLISETAHGSESLDHVADLIVEVGQHCTVLCHLFT